MKVRDEQRKPNNKKWTLNDSRPGDAIRGEGSKLHYVRTTEKLGAKGCIVCIEDGEMYYCDDVSGWLPDDRVYVCNEKVE